MAKLGVGEYLVIAIGACYFAFKFLNAVYVVGLLCTAVAAFYLYLRSKYQRLKKLGISGPEPTLIFGNALDFSRKGGIYAIDTECMKKYGNIYGLYIMDQPQIVVGDLDLIKQIVVKDFNVFPNRMKFIHGHVDKHNSNKVLMDSVLNVLRDDEWKNVRNTITPAFTAGKMKLMIPIINDSLDTLQSVFEAKIAANSPSFNVNEVFGAFTLEVIAAVAFATQTNCQQNPNDELVKMARRVFETQLKNPLVILSMLFPFTVNKLKQWFKIQLLFKKEDEFFKNLLQRMIDERRKKPPTRPDFLSLMLKTQEASDSPDPEIVHHEELISGEEAVAEGAHWKSRKRAVLSDHLIMSQCFFFLIAGFDTTAATLTFLAYVLAKKPELQLKCVDEIQRIVGDKDPSYDDLNQLQYVEMVIMETLRIYPPATRFDRSAEQDHQIGDLKIPKGTNVAIPVYVLHHSEEYWPEPEEFRPERFTPEERRNRNPFTYLPFGYGPRNCIGMRFAMMELKMVLCRLLPKFEFFPSAEMPAQMEVTCKAHLKPKQTLYLGVRKRKN